MELYEIMSEYEPRRTIFSQFVKDELTVIEKALEFITDSLLSEEEIEYKQMCLGSVRYELKGRYQIE